MDKNKAKAAGLKRRQRRVRGKIFGTPERPRLRVVRTNANIYAMIVDDTQGKTLVSASTLEAEFRAPTPPTRRLRRRSASSWVSAPSRLASRRSVSTVAAVSIMGASRPSPTALVPPVSSSRRLEAHGS